MWEARSASGREEGTTGNVEEAVTDDTEVDSGPVVVEDWEGRRRTERKRLWSGMCRRPKVSRDTGTEREESWEVAKGKSSPLPDGTGRGTGVVSRPEERGVTKLETRGPDGLKKPKLT